MKVDWPKYKSVLRKAYMGEKGVMPKNSKQADDFWTFFGKYVTLMEKQADTEKSSDYSKYNRCVTRFDLDKTDRYSLREVPKPVIAEFEFIINAYLDFCQREKFAKLKKLRQSQENLPIFSHKEEILAAVSASQVTIIAGDTGCGKSTQVPQYLMAHGFDRIACTQPRRIACISLCNRVAYETLQEYGSLVAYQIRFEKTRTQKTKMLFLTEGLMLRQMVSDPELTMYDVIILDEIHERHLHGDFLMGLLKDLVERRTDVKLILMSATINLDLFCGYFKEAPVIQVPGRLFPINLEFVPPVEAETKGERIDPAPYLRILQRIDQKYSASERGDVLIFLSGISEISTVADVLQTYAENSKRWIILMLHSTLSLDEQDRVFDIAPDQVRKCILSTNIAETSVTIDGVRFVVDSGKVKEMTYDASLRMQCLKETWVSQASAEQRKGRAGRTGPGHCYRLYSEQEYEKFDKYTKSEIHRVSLEALVLQMYHMNVSDPRHFPFIEAPSLSTLEEAIVRLRSQGAITITQAKEEIMTPLGNMLVRLPVDLAIGKLLIMGCVFKRVDAVLTMAAALSIQSLFTNRSFRDPDSQALRQSLLSDVGDAFGYLNVYRTWLELKAESAVVTKKWCHKRGIEEQRLYEMSKLSKQFKELLEDTGLMDKFEENMSSQERRLRHGELQRLRELKRKHQSVKKERKVLKVDKVESVMPDADEVESGDPLGDLASVEFRLGHSDRVVREKLETHDLDGGTVTLLKLSLAASLYPQYALLDLHNSFKQGADILVHTKAKPFVCLHPNSSLAQDPSRLMLDLDEFNRSPHHQLLFYVLLLDTTKSYVVNSLRVPALHSLLLVATPIHTSPASHKILADNWIEFMPAESSLAQVLIAMAYEIRQELNDCMHRKLNGQSFHASDLAKKLLKFFNVEISYSMRRVSRIELQDLYSHISLPIHQLPKKLQTLAETGTASENTALGGWDFGDYLTYGCLTDSDAPENNSANDALQSHWICPRCKEEMWISGTEKAEHLSTCGRSAEAAAESAAPPAGGRQYFCDLCSETLQLTPIEILKHKRSHKGK